MSERRKYSTLGVLVWLVFSCAGSLATAQLNFSTPVSYSLASPTAVAVGDFDGDGNLDLAVVNSGSGGVSILLGNGDGTFQSAATYHVSNSPIFVAVGDFNGDHKLDLAVANGPEGTVSILTGKGDGSFEPPVNVSSGTFAGYLAIADFNGDGEPDLLAFNNQLSSSGTSVISVLLGNGDGTFQSAMIDSFQTDGNLTENVVVGDFDEDGHLDVAIGEGGHANDEGTKGNLIILRGNGDGTFKPAEVTELGCWPLYLAVGKFNADTKADLAMATQENVFGSDIKILRGNGDGTFTLAPNLQHGTQGYGFGTSSVAVADLNGDGKLDVMGLESVDPQNYPMGIQVLLGIGDGTFQNQVTNPCLQSSNCIPLSRVPSSLVAGDFNGDGLPDLAVTSLATNTRSIFLNHTVNATLPDFSLAPASKSLTVQPGGQGPDVITIAPKNGSFGNAIQLTCAITGPAPMPTCALSPSSVTPDANSMTSTLTITVPAPAAQLRSSGWQPSKSLYALGLPLMFGMVMVKGSKARRRQYWTSCGVLLVLLVVQTACGGSHSSGTQSPTNYTVTVTGASGAIQHSTQLTVTVR